MGQTTSLPSAVPVCGRGKLTAQLALHDLPSAMPTSLIDIIVNYTGGSPWIVMSVYCRYYHSLHCKVFADTISSVA
jgi:hypothetical protein